MPPWRAATCSSQATTNQVLRYDDAGAFIGVAASGGGLNGPAGMVFAPDGDLLVASQYGDGKILRFDGTTGALSPSSPATLSRTG